MKDHMRKGFTLIELMIVFCILAILAALLFRVRECRGDVSGVDALAAEWASQTYPPDHEVYNILCQDIDSDLDGYVSCTVSIRDPQGHILTPPIECSPLWGGCRFPKSGRTYWD